MPRLPRAITVDVFGDPAPQGSLTCKAKHVTRPNLQPENERELKRWRALVAEGGRALLTEAHGRSVLPLTPYSGALLVIATHTIARPRTIPLSERAWPIKVSPGHGDVDKLGRALLDGLATAGVYGNDAQVCGLHVWKRYPDSPTVQWINPTDHLARPGVVFRMIPIEQGPDELPFDGGPADA